MENEFEKIIITKEQIKEIVQRLGKQISLDYKGKDLVVIGMLKGAMPFMMDLIKEITIPIQIDFMQISSYHGGTTSANIVFKKDIEINVMNKHVIIVDDIVDSGITMNEVMSLFATRKIASFEAACLIDKASGRRLDFKPKYVGTTIEGGFVVGYGLDYDERYRNLPYVAILSKKIYEK